MHAKGLAVLLLVAVAGCDTPPPNPLPPPGPPVAAPAEDLGAIRAMPSANVESDFTSSPDIPTMPGLPRAAPSPVYTAPSAAAPSVAPSMNSSGPVTNYGAGGMQAMPGAAPNAPYPAGGLMH